MQNTFTRIRRILAYFRFADVFNASKIAHKAFENLLDRHHVWRALYSRAPKLLVILVTVAYMPEIFDWIARSKVDVTNLLTGSIPNSINPAGGLVYHYQTLVTGMLAVGAALLAFFSPFAYEHFQRRAAIKLSHARAEAFCLLTEIELGSVLASQDEEYQLDALTYFVERNKEFYSDDEDWAFGEAGVVGRKGFNTMLAITSKLLEAAAKAEKPGERKFLISKILKTIAQINFFLIKETKLPVMTFPISCKLRDQALSDQ